MEGRTLDYKLTLPGNSDEEKREFLADVTSFANASGGDIVYGAREANGVIIEMAGLGAANIDAEKLRLEDIVRNGVAPRIPNVRMQSVTGFAGGPILVLRISRSFASPHMVTFKQWSRFFTRNNAGKHQLDVTELRSAFLLSESLGERVQRFRTDRLSKIIAGETPVPTKIDTAKLVLHVLPLSSFSLDAYIEGDLQRAMQLGLRPIGTSGWDHRHNVDGYVTFGGQRQEGGLCASYTQLFRTGAIEAVWGDVVRERDGNRFIASVAYEQYTLASLKGILKVLSELSVPLPLVITLSMTGVKDADIFVDFAYASDQSTSFDRDVLLLPDVIADSYDVVIAKLMRPIFDAVWNAAGYARSFNYNEAGEWTRSQ